MGIALAISHIEIGEDAGGSGLNLLGIEIDDFFDRAGRCANGDRFALHLNSDALAHFRSSRSAMRPYGDG